MKTLLLLRHASAGWDELNLSDRDRPLDVQGRNDLARLSRWCAGRPVRPDLILTSPAARARDTARAFADGFALPVESVVVDDRLYNGSARTLSAAVEGLDDGLARVALVGHNPEFTDLCRSLGSGIPYLPDCALAEFDFDTDTWSGLLRRRAVGSVLHQPALTGAGP